MKGTRIAMVGALALTLASTAFAQMSGTDSRSSSDQMSIQSLRATVQRGPYMGSSRLPSGDVFIGQRFVMRIPSSAGGYTPMQRATVIAGRLNAGFAAGLGWNDLSVRQVGGLWTVALGDRTIATADRNSARSMGLASGLLASRWAGSAVVALGGEPTVVAQQINPFGPTQMVAGSRQELTQLNWATSPSKSVPLIDAATGAQRGNVTVAGASDLLNMVNAVALTTVDLDGATAYAFVPTADTSVGVNMRRVAGVGVVGVSTDALPSLPTSLSTPFLSTFTRMNTRWNAAIVSDMIGQRMQIIGNNKLVPLYSADSRNAIGAVQVLGRSNAVAAVRSATFSGSAGAYNFNALTTGSNAADNVVISAIVLPSDLTPTTTTAPSTTTEPSEMTTPGTTETPATGGTCPPVPAQ